MTTQNVLSPGLASAVLVGGTTVQVANKNMGVNGGFIMNPLSSIDQNIHIVESIYVDIVDPHVARSSTIVELVPGESFIVPPLVDVWVTANTSGHKFTAVFSSPYSVDFPPGLVPGQPGSGQSAPGGVGEFPPAGVTGLTTVLPSYLYQEYSDDDDLQGFCQAQNTAQQDFVDTFNALNLPIYPGPIVADKLLDWVGRGVYGMARPSIGTGMPLLIGPLNTWTCNWGPPYTVPPVVQPSALNMLEQLTVGDVVLTNDDLYRRILTWHFYKGDGNYFCTRWLKRRIWRFLFGVDGWSANDYPPGTGDWSIADTEQISVSLGVERNVTMRFVLGKRTVTGGALINAWGPNGFEPTINKAPPWDIGTDITPSGGGVNWQFNPVVNNGFGSSSNDGILVVTGTSVSGSPIVAGLYVSGAGVPPNTIILWQISGTLGGNGSYQIGVNMTISSVAIAFNTHTWINLGGGGAKAAPGGIYLNDIETTYVTYPALPMMVEFKEAMDIGVLELPYQYNYTVHIG